MAHPDLVATKMLVQPVPQYWVPELFKICVATHGDSWRVYDNATALLTHERRRFSLGRRMTEPSAEEVVARARTLEPIDLRGLEFEPGAVEYSDGHVVLPVRHPDGRLLLVPGTISDEEFHPGTPREDK